ncbi:hypothetical protein AVEN_49629-1 [Araneus ventricosus]|uniref:Uncharacterized protein n=1 Tax=Araneus ventricosus TaxID=182803 RepID=A0A4Y2U9S3_ARAVE|nr:hypothetical protein AVEN_49629-1 [Araneus ventricosus]
MRTSFQISDPSISEKGKSHWEIVKQSNANALACSEMVSSSCMKISILHGKLKNWCKSSNGKSEATPYSPDLAPNLGSKHLSGTRFSSNINVKTGAENWLYGQGRAFTKLG